jgi:hypothetical protein
MMTRSLFVAGIVAAFLARSTPARAMSCAPMADHYLLLCDRAECRPLFRAHEGQGYGMCGRAMAISTFPVWAKQPIVEAIRNSTPPPERPLVTAVAIIHRHLRFPSTERELREVIENGSDLRVSQHAEGPEQVRVWYERRSTADARRIRILKLQHMLAGCSLLVALVGTSIWFSIRLIRRGWSASRGLLWHVLAIRLGLFVLGLGFIATFLFVPPPMLLLAPMAMLFALLDLAMYELAWWRKR